MRLCSGGLLLFGLVHEDWKPGRLKILNVTLVTEDLFSSGELDVVSWILMSPVVHDFHCHLLVFVLARSVAIHRFITKEILWAFCTLLLV